jgi:hypothetical protein
MMPIQRKAEPVGFDTAVRKPGRKWLAKHAIPRTQRLRADVELEPYWRACLDDLHRSYDGICAYLCIYIERVMGAASTDHFIAKSRIAGLAYEWSNYRLACTAMNARKRDFDTVLDPFTLQPGTFRLELVSGRIYPAPRLSAARRRAAQRTIDRLGLDDAGCRELRARRFSDYLEIRGAKRNRAAEAQLQRYAPFLYEEAKRQELL